MDQVAARFDRRYFAVYRILRQERVPMRSPGGDQRKRKDKDPDS